MILHNHYLKSRRGQVLTEQAFVLAAIAGIVLVVVARMGSETSSVFDQLSRTFPRLSGKSGRQPSASRPKRRATSPTPTATPTASNAAPTTPVKSPAMKTPSKGHARRAAGGGGLPKNKRTRDPKRDATVSWGVTSTSSGGGGALSVLFGR